jgi:subtilisin family serine protease
MHWATARWVSRGPVRQSLLARGQGSVFAPSGVQGVAPGASIVAVQVFSFDQQRVQRPAVFVADLIMAMEAAVSAMPSGSTANPYTINLSLGGGQYSGPCSAFSPAFSNAALTLGNLGIPIIAATGNDFFTGQVAWPACTPGVVQVSSVANDGLGNTRSNFGGGAGANLASPAQFPAAYIWLVPGGGNATAVVSSRLSAPGTAAYTGLQGTSQAAPHVAGVYAAVKAGVPGATVGGVSEWIRGNARVTVPISMCVVGPCVPSDTVIFDRIRIPNF